VQIWEFVAETTEENNYVEVRNGREDFASEKPTGIDTTEKLYYIPLIHLAITSSYEIHLEAIQEFPRSGRSHFVINLISI
jgi:hypothetical protein